MYDTLEKECSKLQAECGALLLTLDSKSDAELDAQYNAWASLQDEDEAEFLQESLNEI